MCEDTLWQQLWGIGRMVYLILGSHLRDVSICLNGIEDIPEIIRHGFAGGWQIRLGHIIIPLCK